MANPKIATIVPLAHLDLIKDDDYFMALSYAIDNKDYAGFFAERAGEGKHVILDNSAVELGEPENFVTYLDKAQSIHASEIMLPDIFQDAEETIHEASKSLPKIKSKYHFDLMIIPQGKTLNEWMACKDELENLALPYCKWMETELHVGVSARYTDLFGGSRMRVIDFADSTQIHFLGCYANPIEEIQPILDLWMVCGIDSSYPSVFAKNGLILSAESIAMPRPMTKLDLLNDVYNSDLLRSNIRMWRSACRNDNQTT